MINAFLAISSLIAPVLARVSHRLKISEHTMKRQLNFLETGQRFKVARNELNIQQKDMGATLCTLAGYLRELEGDKGNSGTDFFLKSASKYNIRLNYLFWVSATCLSRQRARKRGKNSISKLGSILTKNWTGVWICRPI